MACQVYSLLLNSCIKDLHAQASPDRNETKGDILTKKIGLSLDGLENFW